MTLNGNQVASDKMSDTFAEFFDKKVVCIVESTRVEPGVYNGRRKIHAEDWMFMTGNGIFECIKSLKIRNTESYDRIPQMIIIDGQEVLGKPLEKLFSMVYMEYVVPGQWLNINGNEVISKKSIYVPGVIFDSKLQWSDHISHAIEADSLSYFN